jgi:hypothetical protein
MKILSFDVGIINLAYCIFDTSNSKILHWEVISLENTKDHCKLHINLIRELDKREFLIDDIDVVLIEKQPSFNPKMRIIGGCLQTYFFIRGVIDCENKQKKKINIIKFFSPKHKLKCHNGPQIEVTGSTKYLQTKKMGVIICREKLNENNETFENKQIFEKSKKKDDLSDCYLQAITYSMFEKLITNNSNDLSNSNNKSRNIIQPIKIITKMELKKNFKEFLEENKDKNTLELLNGLTEIEIPEVLKIGLINKYSFIFPLNIELINKLFSEMNIKKLINLS